MLLPLVPAGAAAGGQTHDGRRRFQAELAEHARGVFLVDAAAEFSRIVSAASSPDTD